MEKIIQKLSYLPSIFVLLSQHHLITLNIKQNHLESHISVRIMRLVFMICLGMKRVKYSFLPILCFFDVGNIAYDSVVELLITHERSLNTSRALWMPSSHKSREHMIDRLISCSPHIEWSALQLATHSLSRSACEQLVISQKGSWRNEGKGIEIESRFILMHVDSWVNSVV